VHMHNGVLARIPIRTKLPVPEPLGVSDAVIRAAVGTG
jgi:hypothetical protein